MATLYKKPDKGDPSDVFQVFPHYELQLLCCRYWWLRHWEFAELSYPYWRVYHNSTSGAVITFDGRDYELTPGTIVVIAPNTSYSTRLFGHPVPGQGYHLEGARVESGSSAVVEISSDCVYHLFIHFNIGVPYDNVLPGVFVFEVTEHLNRKLAQIMDCVKDEHVRFSFGSVLLIQSFIADLLAMMPVEMWDAVSTDGRIVEVLTHIGNHLEADLSNRAMASRARMATNAFHRLFVDEVGMPPPRYVKKKRIDQACILLHHSDYTIERVASETGFADRYHFSRIFKMITGISPALYRSGVVFK